ncbi:MAG TPA: polysaccharide deacetylase family protein [Solirubrobacteraceae bacterium]|jgi:peptidoglycan/xylan/chitin deacetylase (PgdA/CDA1 family)|nr:polysaccharide deacetylase family protein [Solirubrobacteraceae bacterium]
MIRYVFAMHVPAWGRALDLPLNLQQLRDAGFPPLLASGPAAVTQHQSLASGPPAVAITFDDGPHPEGTPRMLEALAQAQATATFFMVGEQVAKRPALARLVVAQGHAVGLHGYLHRPHPLRKPHELVEDFERGLAAIEDATGATPLLHRPPFGIYSPASLRLARERALQPLLWSRWGKDWRKVTTPERITGRVTSGLEAGDVILLHDADYYSARCSHKRTAAALPQILRMLKSAGFDTVAYA